MYVYEVEIGTETQRQRDTKTDREKETGSELHPEFCVFNEYISAPSICGMSSQQSHDHCKEGRSISILG